MTEVEGAATNHHRRLLRRTDFRHGLRSTDHDRQKGHGEEAVPLLLVGIPDVRIFKESINFRWTRNLTVLHSPLTISIRA